MKKEDAYAVALHEKTIQKFIEEKRPPAHLRDEVDLGYSFDNQVVEIFEIRERWDKKSEKVRVPVAKTRWVKSKNLWKIYWMRGSGKWELYKPKEEVKNLAEVFRVISEDKHGCFWG